MKFSNSKLKTFFNCPFVYHLNYDLGIYPKIKPKALDFGSAVHWGLEHNTSDLDDYYKETLFKNNDAKILQEVMIQSYLDNKEKIFDKILIDEDGNKLELLEEIHEIELTTKLNSLYNMPPYNEFVGIIDLLLLTNKGFIIVDYKTSSKKPDFNEYTQQLYTYNMLCNSEFPDVPVYKLAVINLQKSSTKRKNQTELQYKKQLEKEYILVGDDDDLIRVNVFDRDTLIEEENIKFKQDLESRCDFVAMVTELANKNHIWYINWDSLKEYGGSPYLPLINKERFSWELYYVKDKYLANGQIMNIRPMRAIDFDNIFNNIPDYVCRYEDFKIVYEKNPSEIFKDDTEFDDELIENYIEIYRIENKSK